jgi:hypothetical protein
MTDLEKPDAPQPFDEAEYRRRQRSRANLMGVLLIALAVLFFAITIAKMQIFQ